MAWGTQTTYHTLVELAPNVWIVTADVQAIARARKTESTGPHVVGVSPGSVVKDDPERTLIYLRNRVEPILVYASIDDVLARWGGTA